MVRRTDTEWFSDDRLMELRHALTHPEESWAYPERPDILLALDELIAWTNDAREYDDRLHKSGWASVISDFFAATKALGTEVQQRLATHVSAVRSLCHTNIGGDEPARAKLTAEASAMRLTLGETATLLAAWQDLVRVCGRKEATIHALSARRDTFWAVARATDRNVAELSRWLTGVLTGRALSALDARRELGEIDENTIDFPALHAAPLMSVSERLHLAGRLLANEPTSKAHVVWLAFKRAHLQGMGLDLGSVLFFDGQWLKGNLASGAPARPEVPAELSTLSQAADSIPDERDVVVARVDLGVGTFSDAVRVANERLDALLGMSTIGCPDPWERMPGFLHAQEGRVVSWQSFRYNELAIDSRYLWEGTAAQISQLAPRIAPRIPIQEQSMQDVIDALHWWRIGLDQPTAAALILNVRVIELVASRVGETDWTKYLNKYVKNWWIRSAMVNSVAQPLYEALHHRVAPEATQRQREIFLKATPYTDGQSRFHVEKAAGHLDELVGFIPPDVPLGRDLRTVKRRTSNAAAIQAWCAELEGLWAGWEHRLERVRNAIAHGGPFTEPVVMLAQPFSQLVSVHALWESVDGFLEGKTLTQSHIDSAAWFDQWRTSMQTATSIEGIFANAR